MKRRLCPCLWLLFAPLLAAQEPAGPPPEQMAAAFAVRPPDEGSPFFGYREAAREDVVQMAGGEIGGAMLPDGNAQYPTVRGDDRTILQMFTGFFTGMFASVRNPFVKEPAAAASLELDPPEFSLADRREVEANFQVANRTRRILRLDYPTSQRIEILTRSPSGEIVERWSDDRAFDQSEGIVFINPGERISYSEKIPTRDMKAGETYTIEAEVAGSQEYRAQVQVTPLP
ncbi:MAG: BsuPI-related putative proteinase inhibitor [Terrimicrobiaceae bacterium]|nr:BsuPI-related putative proteinase inhibitor [Terrimicrobiaceae bacterium]